MRRSVLIIVVLSMLSATSGYGSSDHAWVARHHSLDHDEPNDVVVSPDGRRVFVTGSTEPYIEGTTARESSDWLTLALGASTGEELWAATFEGDRDDHAYAAAITPDGQTLFVAGQSGSPDAPDAGDATVVAYDTTHGDVRWRKTIDGADDIAPDMFDELVVSHDGSRVIAVGSVGAELDGGWVPPLSRLDAVAVALGVESGQVLWQRQWDGSGNDLDHATGVAMAVDGTRVAIVAQSIGSSGWMNARTLLVRTSDGGSVWSRETDLTLNDVPLSVEFVPDGSALLVAGSADGAQRQSFIQRLSSIDGTVTWSRTVESRNYRENLMALSPSGAEAFIVGARLDSPRGGWAATAVSVRDGSVLWTERLGTYGSAVDVRTLIDGTVVVAGDIASDESVSGFDFFTVGLSPEDGSVMWRGSYDGGLADDRVSALAVSSDGRRVFTAGSSWHWESSSFDYAVSTHGPGCDSGAREEGPVSRPLDTIVESTAPAAHEINCDVVSPAGL